MRKVRSEALEHRAGHGRAGAGQQAEVRQCGGSLGAALGAAAPQQAGEQVGEQRYGGEDSDGLVGEDPHELAAGRPAEVQVQPRAREDAEKDLVEAVVEGHRQGAQNAVGGLVAQPALDRVGGEDDLTVVGDDGLRVGGAARGVDEAHRIDRQDRARLPVDWPVPDRRRGAYVLAGDRPGGRDGAMVVVVRDEQDGLAVCQQRLHRGGRRVPADHHEDGAEAAAGVQQCGQLHRRLDAEHDAVATAYAVPVQPDGERGAPPGQLRVGDGALARADRDAGTPGRRGAVEHLVNQHVSTAPRRRPRAPA